MPPYWMLGFQLSRYGYKNVSMMRDAIDRTLQYDIPLVRRKAVFIVCKS